jgi:predicted MPP superfamily phosphohydrolase
LGIQNPVWRKLPPLLFTLAAVLSQLYLGKRFGLNKLAVRLITIVYVVVAIAITFEIYKDPPQPINFYIDRIGAIMTEWGWLVDVAAIVFLFRDFLPAKFSAERRKFLNVASAAVCAAPAIALTTGFITRKDFDVKEFDLRVPNLPKDLQGLRLLQLSDIHMGAFYSRTDLRRVVDASNNLRADLAFITGDLITGKMDPLDDCLLELKRLRSHSGIWGCMGNHERLAKVSAYTAKKALEMDIRFLRRQRDQLKFGDSSINLVGVDHQFKSEGYLTGLEEFVDKDKFNLLLSHNPDVFPVAAKQGFQLTLAGHTHGGQINVEVAHQNINIVDLVTPYTKGLYTKPDSALYVTSGLGTIGVPVRLGAPSEITLIRLCKS